MKGLLSFLNLNFLPKSPDFALLALRIVLGGSMLVLHGWKKAELYMGWGSWSGKEIARKARIAEFPDPLHLSSQWSLLSAGLVEVVCSVLLIVGFCSRFAALGLAFTMGVAFFMAHQRILSGEKSGELAMIYLAGFIVLLFSGPGRFSFDGNGGGSAGHAAH